MRKSNRYLLECKEIPLLFKLLGRHRALRELAKARPMSCRSGTAVEKSIMERISWGESRQGAYFWAKLHNVVNGIGNRQVTRESLLKESSCA